MNRTPLFAGLAVVALLAIVVIGEWLSGSARLAAIDAPLRQRATVQDRPAAAAEIAAPPDAIDAWTRTALARPLMSASRHAAARVGSAISLSGGMPRLTGTLSASDTRVAIFARDDGGHPVVVREGAALGPYRVSRIAPNSVTLVGPGGAQTVHPRFGSKQTPAIATDPDAPDVPSPMNMPGVLPQMPNQGPPFRMQPVPQ